MDFELTEEQRLIQQTAKDFAEKQVAPAARIHDREGQWPGDLVAQMGALGFMGMSIPEQWGGAGSDALGYALAMEEVSAACASVGVIMSVNNSLVCDPIHKFGNEFQRKEILTQLASGKALGCFGLTEPSSGSDASSMDTVATQDGDHWNITGSKNWITNGPHADFIVVMAVTDRSKGSKGVTTFLVPTGTPGFSCQEPDEKMGIHGAHSCTVFFENCRVHDRYRLGDLGGGFRVAMTALDGGRIGIGCQALGIARAAYEKALAYSQERKAFGVPLSQKQAIQFKLADMATEIEAARLLLWQACSMKNRGVRHTQESAVAKLFASEMATRVTHQAMQVFGGYGYSKEYDMERHYRDARITEIYEGTSEIMRIVIAKSELAQ